MKFKITISLIVLLFVNISVNAQESKERKWDLSGYVSNMQSIIIDSLDGNWVNDNLIHNRLIFNYNPVPSLTFNTEIRNRIITGETVKYMPNYAESMSKDPGIIDLSTNLVAENSILINSQIDRAILQYEKGNLSISAGRQRINWGRSFVWNPNDIFNSYSFFDFDYPERPGSDAIRIEYYTGAASSAEIAVKADSSGIITGAGLFKTNIKGYDFQFLAGIVNEEKIVFGMGWEGYIKSISFRGEASYIHPKDNFADTSGIFIADVSFDYTFENSLMIQTEVLWTKKDKSSQITGFNDLFNQPQGIENLSFSEFSIFTSATYPISPLLNVNLSAIYYPDLNGFFAGPNVSYSLTDNLDFSVTGQYFHSKIKDSTLNINQEINITLAFIRLKYSF